jgi:hypothetical protein
MEGTLTLSTAGLTSKDHTVLKSLFSLVERDLDKSWRLTPEADGDIFLVDVDSDDGRMLWGQLSNTPGHKCAAVTRDRAFDAPHLLHKPLRRRELLQLLNEYAVASFGPAEEDAWLPLAMSHKPDHYTLAEHLRRRSWTSGVLLRRPGAPDLVLDPGSGSWYADAELSTLASYLNQEIGVHEAYPLGQRDLLEFSRHLPRRAMIDLQWYAGLSLGNGQLHPDIHSNDRIGMMRVPHQAKANGDHRRIAEALISRPSTPEQLVERCNLPINVVARFLNACLMCGWLIVDRSEEQLIAA